MLIVFGPPDVTVSVAEVASAAVVALVDASATTNVSGACAGVALACDHVTVTAEPAFVTVAFVG